MAGEAGNELYSTVLQERSVNSPDQQCPYQGYSNSVKTQSGGEASCTGAFTHIPNL